MRQTLEGTLLRGRNRHDAFAEQTRSGLDLKIS